MSFEFFIEKRKKLIKSFSIKYQNCTNPVMKEGYLRKINHLNEELKFSRPDTQSDIDERKMVLNNYANTIKKTITDDHPLWFHGVNKLATLEKILISGNLGYADDDETRSLTPPGTLDVTSKDSIDTTIKGFTGLSSEYLPAGCIFVLHPKDADEAKLTQASGSEQNIKTVDFNKNPERLYAIVSTTENLNYISDLVARHGLNKNIVQSFDSFIKKYKADYKQNTNLNLNYQNLSHER